MATSRRRERELARRRFERRRQAELERRARAKRRNTVLGAVIGTVAVIVVLVIIGIAVFGGSSNKSKAKASSTPTASPTASATSAADSKAPKRCKKISPNPPLKGAPHVPDVTGRAPTTKLVTKDVTIGHGPAAKNGDDLDVFYTGISCTTGKLFDSSYKSTPASPLPITNLGSGGLIPGFAQGLVGMKAGGVRELVIPGPLAYASQPASAPTFPNDTLIFLVSVKSITPAK